MSEKNINTRIIHKHDTEANWNLATNFIPKQGELIVYDKDSAYNYERFKIGDGVTNVNSLPFATDRQIDYNALANKPLKMTTVSLLSESWVGANSLFSQTVVINGITSSSKIDLQPTFIQLLELQDAEITLMITNDNGIATAYAMNNKPTKDYEMQVLITEVSSS